VAPTITSSEEVSRAKKKKENERNRNVPKKGGMEGVNGPVCGLTVDETCKGVKGAWRWDQLLLRGGSSLQKRQSVCEGSRNGTMQVQVN